MGKPKARHRKPGAIGPDGLSHYARKRAERAAGTSEPPAVEVAWPPQPKNERRFFAIIPQFSISQQHVFARTQDGRQLYIPMSVIRRTTLKLKPGNLIECETVPDPEGRSPRVTHIYSSTRHLG